MWIAQNSGYKIQVATDSIIETFNPQNYSFTWGFQAVRMPMDGEREEIRVTPTCGRVPACAEPLLSVLARLKRFILN